MVISQPSATFRAIADPTRRAILDLLAEGDLTVTEIVARFCVSQPAISRHLRLLREAGLVRERRVGRSRSYRIEVEPLRPAEEWIAGHRLAWTPGVPTLRAWVEGRSARAA